MRSKPTFIANFRGIEEGSCGESSAAGGFTSVGNWRTRKGGRVSLKSGNPPTGLPLSMYPGAESIDKARDL